MSYAKEKDGIFRADFRFKGIPRLHLSLGTKKASEAKNRYAAVRILFTQRRVEMIEQLRTGVLTVERIEAMVRQQEPIVAVSKADDAAHSWGTVDGAIARYLAWIDAHPNRSAGTYRIARSELRRFAAFVHDGTRVGGMLLDDVRSGVVTAYQSHLLSEGAPPNTVSSYMTRVGALWRWQGKQEVTAAREERRVARTIFTPVDPEMLARDKTARERYLTPEEAERLLAATPEQLLPVVCFGLFAGLRRGEALHLTARDVDLDIGIVTIKEQGLPDGKRWKPKTRRSLRSVPVSDDLRTVLEARRLSSDTWFTPSPSDDAWPLHEALLQKRFIDIVRDATLPYGRKDPNGVTFHTLRHTFASWLVMRGVDLYTTAQLLGDTLDTVERVYAHISPDFKRAAIAKLRGAVKLPQDVTQTEGV